MVCIAMGLSGRTDETHGYNWLEHFWSAVIAHRPDRRWQVLALIDGDLLLRDGLAHALIRSRLHGRDDIDYRYVRAWTLERDRAPSAAEAPSIPTTADFVFLGRTKPYAFSRYAEPAKTIEGSAFGEFVDPNNGRLGSSIRYDKTHLFSRRALEEQYQFWPYRRCDTDYGLLFYLGEGVGGGQGVRLAIGGLGSLGTLLLAVILTDDRLRHRLVEQVEELSPSAPHHRPDEQAEICVRVQVDGDKQLANLVNDLNEFAAGRRACPFDFQVVAVGVASDAEPGKAKCVRDPSTVELQLKPSTSRRGGGEVRVVNGQSWVSLPRQRFALLRQLLTEPEKATIDALCRQLGFRKKASKAPRDTASQEKAERGCLAKLVHDLNESLRKAVFLGNPPRALIRYSKKRRRYVFEGVQGRVREPIEPPPGELVAPARAERAERK
jgi:hypothetical protein